MKSKIILSLFLISVFTFSFNFYRDYAKATENSNVEQNYNNYQASKFITDISFKNDLIASEFRLSDMVELQYKWKLTDQMKGDILIYDIPKELYIINDLEFSLLSKSGIEIGIVKLRSRDNKLEIQFNDPHNLNDKNDVLTGSFMFTVKISPDFRSGDDKQTIEFPMGEEVKELTIIIENEGNPDFDELVFGWGIYNKWKNIVDWDIRINHAEKELDDVSIQIATGDDSVIDDGSIKVYEINGDDLVESEKEIIQSRDGDNLILSIQNLSKAHLISFRVQNNTKVCSLSAILKNQSTILAETGDLSATFTTGLSILAD